MYIHLLFFFRKFDFFQIFNLFDEDGNGNISIEELLNLMAFFIEIGEGKQHKVLDNS